MKDKWGWVIYRSSYGDEPAWDRFYEIINPRSRQYVVDSDIPEYAKSLEWTFVEDQRTLEGVPRD